MMTRLVPLAACLALASCSTNPLALGYRGAAGAGKRENANPNPQLVQPSMSGHGAAVSRYSSRGYRVIGYGQMNARYEVDSQNARMLAIEKDADVAVFSRRYLGKGSETVAVPLATSSTAGYSQYSSGGQYGSQSQSGSQTTIYGYRNQQYDLWEHKTTLLRAR